MITFEKNEENLQYQGSPRVGYSFTYIKTLHSYILFGGANSDNDIYIFNLSITPPIKIKLYGIFNRLWE